MSIKAVFWPLGGQSETDPYDPGKVFLRLTNRLRLTYGKETLKPVLIACAWAARAAITGLISAPTAAAAAPALIPNLNY